jgi:malate synthase
MLLEYLEGWLRGRGAKGIDSLAGKPGIHPALMEDLATARISVAQIAQRVRHGAKDTNTGQVHDFRLAKTLLQEESQSILDLLPESVASVSERAEAAERYRKSLKIAYQWVKNYADLDFRSLGSYTLAQLDAISAAEDAI